MGKEASDYFVHTISLHAHIKRVKNNTYFAKRNYLCTRKPTHFRCKGFLVERFGLLATTVKNAKNLVCQGLLRHYRVISHPILEIEFINRRAIGKIVILT